MRGMDLYTIQEYLKIKQFSSVTYKMSFVIRQSSFMFWAEQFRLINTTVAEFTEDTYTLRCCPTLGFSDGVFVQGLGWAVIRFLPILPQPLSTLDRKVSHFTFPGFQMFEKAPRAAVESGSPTSRCAFLGISDSYSQQMSLVSRESAQRILEAQERFLQTINLSLPKLSFPPCSLRARCSKVSNNTQNKYRLISQAALQIFIQLPREPHVQL